MYQVSYAAAAALLGSSLLAGCAGPLPESPVPAPLTDLQAAQIADDYLDGRNAPDDRFVANVEPTGDGNLVSFRSAFDQDARPPVQSRLVMVKHTGAARELTFDRNE